MNPIRFKHQGSYIVVTQAQVGSLDLDLAQSLSAFALQKLDHYKAEAASQANPDQCSGLIHWASSWQQLAQARVDSLLAQPTPADLLDQRCTQLEYKISQLTQQVDSLLVQLQLGIDRMQRVVEMTEQRSAVADMLR